MEGRCFYGTKTLRFLFQRRVYFSHLFLVGLMNYFPHHSQNTAFIAEKNKSWTTFKLLLIYLSSLATRKYQYSKMREIGGISAIMGVQVLDIIQSEGKVRFRADTSAQKTTSLHDI